MLPEIQKLFKSINQSSGRDAEESNFKLGKIYDTLLSKNGDEDSGFTSFNSTRLNSGLDVSTTSFRYAADNYRKSCENEPDYLNFLRTN